MANENGNKPGGGRRPGTRVGASLGEPGWTGDVEQVRNGGSGKPAGPADQPPEIPEEAPAPAAAMGSGDRSSGPPTPPRPAASEAGRSGNSLDDMLTDADRQADAAGLVEKQRHALEGEAREAEGAGRFKAFINALVPRRKRVVVAAAALGVAAAGVTLWRYNGPLDWFQDRVAGDQAGTDLREDPVEPLRGATVGADGVIENPQTGQGSAAGQGTTSAPAETSINVEVVPREEDRDFILTWRDRPIITRAIEGVQSAEMLAARFAAGDEIYRFGTRTFAIQRLAKDQYRVMDAVTLRRYLDDPDAEADEPEVSRLGPVVDTVEQARQIIEDQIGSGNARALFRIDRTNEAREFLDRIAAQGANLRPAPAYRQTLNFG